MKIKTCLQTFSIALIITATSCKPKSKTPDPEPPGPTPPAYTIPTEYNFVNVNYSGQTTRLDMVDEINTYITTANTPGTALNSQKIKDMYANLNSAFTNSALNVSGKDIKSKVFLADQTLFETYMDNLAAASQSTVNGSNGTPGVIVSSTDPTKKWLFDANGIEWAEVIEKGLMGSLMYYQAVGVYFDPSKTGNAVDNSTVVAGQGTSMEHGWDEAFGYFGVPLNFPTNNTNIRFWGEYCNDRNAILSTNSTMMNAFLKGRAAISNKDYSTRDAQIGIIRNTWETIIASTIISYLNSTKLNLTNDAVRNHNLSEVKGFITNFKCNPTKKITATEITDIENLLGNNFYNITGANIDLIKNKLSTIYGLDAVKNNL